MTTPIRRRRSLIWGLALAAVCTAVMARIVAQPKAESPRIRFETSAGAFTMVTYPLEAPATVAHIVELVKAGFYDGLRVHRALPGFVVQFGDPQSRDDGARDRWGRGADAGSGAPIGVAELSPKRKHVGGAVGVAHMGEPAKGDSQIYVTLKPRPDLDGQYVVFGQVIDGEDVPARLQVGDRIVRATVEP